jgi:hypothetical protein
VCAFFHHATPVNHDDLVSITDSAQPAEGGEEGELRMRSEIKIEKEVETALSICNIDIISYLCAMTMVV